MMKTAVIYSSRTGNTEKVARNIYEILPGKKKIYSVEKAPSPDQFYFLALGFWIDRGLPGGKMEEYMAKVKNKKVGIFFTLGAYPDSDHARNCLDKAKSLLGEGCEVIITFRCQGKIDPRLSKKFEDFPDDHPHAMTPERRA
ncbi:MAG: flavodoxin family protein, partial [bacterium]